MVLFLLMNPIKAEAVYMPTKMSDNTVAYSFYMCSDNPNRGITLSCSKGTMSDFFMYCADYCECPIGRNCNIVHRSYHQCGADMPQKITRQGGNWGKCLARYAR